MTTNGHTTAYYDRDGKLIDQEVAFSPPFIIGMIVGRCHIYDRTINTLTSNQAKAVYPNGPVTAVHYKYGTYEIAIDVSLAELIAEAEGQNQ